MFAIMGNTVLGGTHLVEVYGGQRRELWVVACDRKDAAQIVQKQLPLGFTARLSDQRLTHSESVGANLRAGEARKYGEPIF